jgi:LytR cell envelope-related transcriptional attenuator
MNELDVFAGLRPEVRPLTSAHVDALRAHLFDGAALVEGRVLGAVDGPDGGRDLTELARAGAGGSAGRVRLVSVAAVVVAMLAGVWAISSARSGQPPGSTQPPAGSVVAEPTTAPTVPGMAAGLFPLGGNDGAVAEGYRTPTDVAAAYLVHITDPSRLPPGYRITAKVAASDPVTAVDADRAVVRVELQTADDGGDGRVVVRRISRDPDVWQVVSAVVIPDELTDVSSSAGIVTGSIAPVAGGTTTLFAYDLVTGETLDVVTLTTPSSTAGEGTAPLSFSLRVGDRDPVGLRYWNTVAPAGSYDFANFADQSVATSEVAASDRSTAVRPDPSTPVPSSPDDAAPATGLTALDTAMEPDGVVVVVNGSGIDGLAGSLSRALEDSGYTLRPPVNATETVPESVVYVRGDPPASAIALVPPAIPVARTEQLGEQRIPVRASDDIAEADLIVVLGADLADAPWSTAPTPLVTEGRGVLLVLDGSGTEDGRQRTESLISMFDSSGVDTIDGGRATSSVAQSVLMPIGPSSRWTFAVAELAGIGGFDTWTPALVDGQLPTEVDAVLVTGP